MPHFVLVLHCGMLNSGLQEAHASVEQHDFVDANAFTCVVAPKRTTASAGASHINMLLSY